jgi:hypothetical protein
MAPWSIVTVVIVWPPLAMILRRIVHKNAKVLPEKSFGTLLSNNLKEMTRFELANKEKMLEFYRHLTLKLLVVSKYKMQFY